MPRTYTTKPITYTINEVGCHICTSHKPDKDGYPTMTYAGRLCLVARYIFAQVNGTIPDNTRLLRTCRERLCINPTHLQAQAQQPKHTTKRVVMTPEERFWSRVHKGDDATSCWMWRGGNNGKYGRMKIAPKQSIDAHRFSYILHYGKIPEGRIICHKCNNPACVRPDHLYAGTYKDNYDDMAKAGNAFDISTVVSGRLGVNRTIRGRNVHNAVLDEAIVREIRSRIATGETHRSIATHLGISKSAVTDINTGKNWAWLDVD